MGAWLGSITAAAPFIHATLMLPEGNTSPFTVVDAVTGAVAFTGTAQLFGTGAVHEYYKQVVWHLDFSGLQTEVSAAWQQPGGISLRWLTRSTVYYAMQAFSEAGVYLQTALCVESTAQWRKPNTSTSGGCITCTCTFKRLLWSFTCHSSP